MCTTCGCGHSGPHMHETVDENGNVTITVHDHDHDHDHHDHDHAHPHTHDHDHGHSHDHEHTHDHAHPEHSHDSSMPAGRAIAVEEDILARNNAIADRNRAKFAARHALALNLVSSPGSGKTELLAATLRTVKEFPTAVIEGDQETANDAERIRATGARALQINTGKGCHLDAAMIERALEALPVEENSVLFIENVGNLVCPAEFDLGEAAKVAILSVTEGEDKPLKYPDMFRASSLVLLNKIDLLPYVRFDADKAEANVLRVNPRAKVIRVSATTGEGLEKWIAWVKAQLVLASL
ncbi:hydrogenase nickel incorporation protein HypB [Sutterella sp.]|uniref:hydrogenase nickel incorporation protein HypB n=1 Tax=Sutterella sp. TaxID=1981025 RepID=UPI0026E07D3B|nr:hydrogenase nickel incorporation protein HypB [Sutterella sp.]MDO5530919.1 hydrogenase nickel incorporation protein HypB [Sutterella sp.]